MTDTPNQTPQPGAYVRPAAGYGVTSRVVSVEGEYVKLDLLGQITPLIHRSRLVEIDPVMD